MDIARILGIFEVLNQNLASNRFKLVQSSSHPAILFTGKQSFCKLFKIEYLSLKFLPLDVMGGISLNCSNALFIFRSKNSSQKKIFKNNISKIQRTDNKTKVVVYRSKMGI